MTQMIILESKSLVRLFSLFLTFVSKCFKKVFKTSSVSFRNYKSMTEMFYQSLFVKGKNFDVFFFILEIPYQ
jgi:hypothetical protein